MTHVTKALRVLYTSPNTLLGLLLGTMGLATKGRVQFRSGCLEFYGGCVTWFLKNIPPGTRSGGMAAMTLGHVIVGQSQRQLDQSRAHEHIHVRQYESWGPFFLPAYLGCSLYLWAKRRDPYRDNPFEREAYGQVKENA